MLSRDLPTTADELTEKRTVPSAVVSDDLDVPSAAVRILNANVRHRVPAAVVLEIHMGTGPAADDAGGKTLEITLWTLQGSSHLIRSALVVHLRAGRGHLVEVVAQDL